MAYFLGLLWGTLVLRPYVFIFLAIYLLLAIWHLGWGRALIFLVLGYMIAWLSEWSSINTGFPYGQYIYIEATRGQELWIGGVPFMDSLSYVFLAYASYSMALLALGPVQRQGSWIYLRENKALRTSYRTLILASVLFVTLDVIIDPVALQGYRWFLGQIYGYPEPGIYFGITLSNFMGWLIVGAIMIRVLQWVAQLDWPFAWINRGQRDFAGRGLLGPALYLSILIFNLTITFYIGEFLLGVVGIFILTPLLTLLVTSLVGRLESNSEKSL